MDLNKTKQAIEILINDYDNITPKDLRVLRTIYKDYFKSPVNDFGVYLILKLRLITDLESVRISTKTEKKQFAPFGSNFTTVTTATIPTFNPTNEAFKGVFYVTGDITLPLLNASFKTAKIQLTCLSPDGNFCYISSDEFNFEM